MPQWQVLGETTSVHDASWPTYDKTLVVDQEITMVIQINGKVRDKLLTSRSISEDALKSLALNQESVKKHLEKKEIIKTIVVKERLINFVVK